MEVRVFESFNLQDAVKLAKVELGKDAVIISTREKESYSREHGKNCKLYEITAAPNVSKNTSIISPKLGIHLPKVEFKRVQSQNDVTVVKNSNLSSKATYSPIMSALSQEVKQNSRSYLDYEKEKLHLQEQIIQKQDAPRNLYTQDFDDLRADISRMRREMSSLPQVDVVSVMQEVKLLLDDLMLEKYRENSEHTNSYITDLGIKLRTSGVSEVFISHMSTWLNSLEEPKTLQELVESKEKTKDFYLTSCIQFIFKYLKVTNSFQNQNQRQRIICLMGTTGVGKTTTIAKLAAKLKIQDKKNIHLISMDTYRIGGADQLRAYSKILDCHFSEVSDCSELQYALSKSNRADFIFIDTAGKSMRYAEQTETFRKISQLPIPVEFHLVVSSSMKQRDIDENVKAFKFLSPTSLIFTKLDESWAFGEILNTTLQSKIPLSYFTTGQRVPEDIEVASKERVIERILRI